MRQYGILLTAIFAISLLAGCGGSSYKKTPGGMPYKLFRSKDTQQVVPGTYIKLSVNQKINDSPLLVTDKGLPIYLFVDNQRQVKYDMSEIWTLMHLGDSVVATQMIDTFIKRNPQSVPKEFKKGDRIITSVKVLAIFPNDSIARLDEAKERKNFLAKETKVITDYLAANKITAEKTPSGAFVETVRPGTGNLVDTGNYITINYTGKTWTGRKFDSTTDTTFHHAQPYSYVVGGQPMIKGFDESILMLRKGMVARFYIPSELGYGPGGNPPHIKPFDLLIFDIEVVDVKDQPPATSQ
jgi:FKBP-type peptidyl-prolyl cis-trans isomerase FkpA